MTAPGVRNYVLTYAAREDIVAVQKAVFDTIYIQHALGSSIELSGKCALHFHANWPKH